MKAKKQLTLDYSKWRCGDISQDNSLGKADTQLLNEDGYMCCLGQFSLQLGCKEEQILSQFEPDSTGIYIPFLTTKRDKRNTDLSNKAIEINDDPETTPEEKISLLRKFLNGKGIRLVVKNKPKK